MLKKNQKKHITRTTRRNKRHGNRKTGKKNKDANVEFFKWIFKNHNQTDPTYLKQYDPTFEEFLTFIVQKMPDRANEEPHWTSFT